MGEGEVGLQQPILCSDTIQYCVQRQPGNRYYIYSVASFCAKQVRDFTSHNTQSALRLMHFLPRDKKI